MRLLRREEYWELRRRRMIAETGEFLTRALREPHFAPVIPSFPVGRGRFPPVLAMLFWKRVLFDG
jgi:hypothetical protein